MIAPAARPLVAAALKVRLAEIGSIDPTPWDPQVGSPDREDALRAVMVRHLPRAASASTSEERRQACELLTVIGRQVPGDDVRFLDALNAWFERVDDWSAWRLDPAWQRVKAAYASLLSDWIATLARSAPGDVPPVDRPRWHGPASAISPRRPENARVLILADHAAAALRIMTETDTIEALTVHALICNNQSLSPTAFMLRQAVIAVKTGFRGALRLLRAWSQGRVHVSVRRLHDDGVLRWLERERFWIGLHAMGVIYRPPLFAAFRRGVLNAHIGLLPEYRGRSVMEWSILAGAPTGVTVFFMDAGIDTGREVMLQERIDVRGHDTHTAKRRLFDGDGAAYRAALAKLVAADTCAGTVNDLGRRYYVMSRLFTGVVDQLLSASDASVVFERQQCCSPA